ncbi:DNA-binding protein [Lysobacter arvi]|nr:DNA-binding protein [Lysobacter arvi]
MKTATGISPSNREKVRKRFERDGVNIAEFARTHGLNRDTVYQVLSGAKKGRRGEAHRAAVLLGLKPKPRKVTP